MPDSLEARLEVLARILRRVEPSTASRAILAEVLATLAHGRALPADVESLETAVEALGVRRGRGAL